ncbi:MAG: Hydrogenase [uncultured Sulfurovum sp.]|uniref:Hydrogenase n=1 Tax=uncultured Sulfurovum sp. TaxID=269237 RepID=A0A6S6S6D8_9BACT|nr:MAG: Hydrogenase [uncultured Sulfurovum sp.]
MKITLLVSTYNSLSQAVHVALKDKGYQLNITYSINTSQMQEEIDSFNPEIILCPFLKKYLPEAIYENYPTFIFHPAPIGDRGAYSLDYAVFHQAKEWGGVWLKANETYDAGDIYAFASFEMRESYKASIYRQEMILIATSTLDTLFENIKQENSLPQILNPIHEPLIVKIDWERDSTDKIIKKIQTKDSFPGVLDEILGIPCTLFGVWKEDKFRGEVKEILAKRDGAICLGTIDGAIWITHLKEVGSFKLPATYVLKDKIKGIKEDRIPLIFDKSYATFYETSVEYRDKVGYLCFNFYNGAMSTAQCIRLKYAVEYVKTQCEVLVLVGGMDFFSNGIHLNILEDSEKQGEDGWANINAMNDLIKSIIFADEVVTVASFARNAGAGGVFLGLACDYVVAKEGVVLNPHYQTLGLTGSEYHTYSLPKRVGEVEAQKLLDECLPISVSSAKNMGMIDEVFAHSDYYEELHLFSKSKFDDDFIWDKQDFLEENRDKIEAYKEAEIEVMYPEFWEEDSVFHKLRKEFVWKVCASKTPERLKLYNK